MSVILRYKWVFILLAVDGLIFAWDAAIGRQIVLRTTDSFVEMLSFIPPIFLLLGLLDVWVPREKVIAHLGPKAGIAGVGLSVFLGAAAAGPLYGAFPIAAVMLKKGAGFYNVMIFLGAWATLKIPMFMFETQFLGATFAITRWLLSLTAIIVIALAIDRFTTPAEKAEIYSKHRE